MSSKIVLLIVLSSLQVLTAQGQQKEEIKRQAETQLRQMTPEEIDAKIRELGLTRAEAEARAKELGIDLSTFLQQKRPSPAPTVIVVPPQPEQQPAEFKPVEIPRPVKSEAMFVGPGGLKYFGYDIFLFTPTAFEPTAVGPVDPEYLIGPEDALRVTVWGQAEFQNELVVDREGRIFIPTIGQLMVSGLTLQQTYEKLRKQMSRSYAGLVSQPPTVWLDVTLARLRPKRVFIMGEVDKPGGYTVSSYATVFNSLYSVGGPTVRGSLREVRVIRANKIIARIDLYDYLTGAEKTNDIRVQNNDIVFVPVRGKTVSIRGEVRHPAIYELKENENLTPLLRFCGGLLSAAYTENAQIDRIKPFNERKGGVDDRIVVDISLREVLNKPPKDIALYDADVVQIFSVLEEKKNYVSILGSVWRPGRYELGQIKTVRDLIAAAEGLQPKTYMDVAHLVRFNEDLITRRIVPFELRKVLEDKQFDQKLLPRDEVLIYSTEVIEVKDKYVTIRGEVRNPGRYPLRSNMKLDDLLLLAGGYTEEADLTEAEISRIIPGGLPGDSLAVIIRQKLPVVFSAEAQSNSFGSMVTKASIPEEQFLLQQRDEIFIRPNPHYKLQQNVTIEGDITYPGVYSIRRKGERLSEVLARAGGPTTTSYFGGAEFYRGGKRLLIDFTEAYVKKNLIHDVLMLSGDSIVVPSKPHTVLVTGEVNNPGLLSFIKGDDVSDYIDRAGGLTDSSNYAILITPTGESQRVNFGLFRSDPEVPEGSTIRVLRFPPPPPEGQKVDIGATIKDSFAILTSAATIAFIVWQVTK